MTYAVLKVPANAYMGVRARIKALPQADYGHMIDPATRSRPERIQLDQIALEPEPFRTDEPDQVTRREELAAVLEMIASEGLPGPRDLDVALDAILSIFGEEHNDEEPKAEKDLIPMEFLDAVIFREMPDWSSNHSFIVAKHPSVHGEFREEIPDHKLSTDQENTVKVKLLKKLWEKYNAER